MSSTNNTIFNVSEPTGKDQVALETTAAEARNTAPNPVVAHQVERNANKEHEAAKQVASIAKTLGPNYTGEPTTAIDDFKSDASRTTNAAVAEGKHDVAEAKAASAGYVEQAKALASSALETAQAYLPTSIGGVSAQADKATTRASQEGQGILASVEATAENVYHAVSEAVQPHLEHAREVAQPRVEQAKDTAQKYLNAAGVPGVGPTSNLKPASEHIIPTSTAPLESGPHTVETPYPPYSSAVKGTDVAAETRPTTLN